MSDAIAWSHDLLGPDERWLFRRLAVFVGGFSLDAAEFICATEAGWTSRRAALDVVAVLVDHSLVRLAPAALDEPRYTMLEPVREYGLTLLGQHGEEKQASDAQAAYCLSLARMAAAGMKGEEQVMWLDRLEREHGNLREALRWLVERERVEEAMHLAADVMVFLWIRGYPIEARTQLDALLAHPLGQDPTLGRARALYGVASMALALEEGPAQALAMLEVALAICRERADRAQAGYVLERMWRALVDVSEPVRADAAANEALAIARELEDRHLICLSLCCLAISAHNRNDRETSTALFEAAASAGRSAGDRLGTAYALGHLGLSALDRRDFEAAERHFSEKLRLVTELGSKLDLPPALSSLAELARVRGQYDVASGYLAQALSVIRELGMRPEEAYVMLDLGRLACLRGELVQSREYFRDALAVLGGLHRKQNLVDVLERFARLCVTAGDMRRAARCIGAADALLRELGIPRVPGFWNDEMVVLRDRASGVIGDDAYAAEWSAGYSASVDESIADALALDVGSGPAPASGASAAVSVAGLSRREMQVLRLIAEGRTNQEIAAALFISPRTATSHVSNIMGKLGFTTRTAAVAWAIRNGLA
jgi:DNA-binding CsgD family transcriptional regulator/tetratricopeptide (TPR) repeat protein